ncbi:unnamed protein product [Penicillium salamii]|nr:unnamed protein product [Penicillium salamii]
MSIPLSKPPRRHPRATFTVHIFSIETIPPRLPTEEWRQMCLDVIESVCNEKALRDDEFKDYHIPRCVELGHFLKYAQGVGTPYLTGYGICPFEPVGYVEVQSYAFPDHPNVLRQPPADISTSREEYTAYLQQEILSEVFISGTVDEDLEVLVGALLYCRSDDESENTLQDWAWRVVVFHADGDNPTPLYGRKPRFNSIPEFLDWYSTWLDYVDMDEVQDILWNPSGGHDYPLSDDECGS